jgi:hypothetical protein
MGVLIETFMCSFLSADQIIEMGSNAIGEIFY